MAPDEGHDEGPADEPLFGSPLPPDDRLWRHPSELKNAPMAGDITAPRTARPLVANDSGPSGSATVMAPPDHEARLPFLPSHVPWSAAAVSGILGAVLTLGLVAAAGGLQPRIVERQVVEQVPATSVQQAATAGGGTTRTLVNPAPAAFDVVQIAASTRPAIARVEVDGTSGRGSGSGVLFRDNGYLLTNAHVVQGATSITVVLDDRREMKGELVGADAETDIAVIKIEGSGFPTAVLGSANGLRVGEHAVAIGSPLGLPGPPSVTVGYVSAVGRRLTSPDGPPLLDMIQTDAPIAPGSSGGALLNSRGEVIGITTAIAVSDAGAEGLGFATPIDIARWVADALITEGEVVHVWLGIFGSDLDAAAAADLGITGGAIIGEIVGGSPAAQAGMAPGDVVVEVNGVPINTIGELVVGLRSNAPGTTVELAYLRNGERRTGRATLAERPTNLS